MTRFISVLLALGLSFSAHALPSDVEVAHVLDGGASLDSDFKEMYSQLLGLRGSRTFQLIEARYRPMLDRIKSAEGKDALICLLFFLETTGAEADDVQTAVESSVLTPLSQHECRSILRRLFE
jgi:hypothetical protein